MLNIKVLFSFLAAACLLAACKTDPAYDDIKDAQLAKDDSIIVNYMNANNITAIKGPGGIYYNISKPGVGTRTYHLSDSLNVHYVGKLLLTQVEFDSTATNIDSISTKFLLFDTIKGWQLGIPLIQPGGRIRLIVPSPLAYQNRIISTELPANSILDFDIQLIAAKDSSQFTIIK